MRPLRLLTGPALYLRDLGRDAVEGWNRFWFTPADPTPLGLIRACAGALALWSLFVLGLDFDAFLGPRGWASVETVREYWAGRSDAIWSFWFHVPDDFLRPVWVGCLVVAALFTLGLATRVTGVLTWIVVVSTARRIPFALYGFDQILSTLLLYLAATGAGGQSFSLDRYIARLRRNRAELSQRRKDGRWSPESGVPRETVTARLALRLIQCHLVAIYAIAGLAKLQGRAWWEGNAIWGTLAAGEFRRFDLTWLASYPLLMNLLTHLALGLELLYPVLIWVPRLRPILIVSMIGLHLGVDLTLALTEFGLAMITANFAFASGPWLRSLTTGDVQPAGRVLYDGACPRCRASMAVICAGDPDRVIAPVDLTAVDVTTIHPSLTKAACLEAMRLVRADGRVESGYDAVMRILSWTPLFSLPALVRFVPGVAWVGRRVYNAIASSRPRDVPCTDEVCGIHPPAGRTGKSSEAARSAGR